MARLLHIVCAVVGLAGAYAYGAAFFLDGSASVLLWAKAAELAGLAGLAASGIRLYIKEPQRQLASGKFLSNMSILALLCLFEAAMFAWPFALLRVEALVSWTWIFFAAALNPPYRYATFMLGYAFALSVGCAAALAVLG